MKFWLTVIISIIFSSAALTWLWMNVGGNAGLEDPYASTIVKKDEDASSPAVEAKPKLDVVIGENQQQEANVVVTSYGDCKIDEEHSAEFKYRNVGKGPIQFVLRRLSCECLKEFTIDGEPFDSPDGIRRPPGHEGVMKLVWLPTDKQLPPRAKPKEQRFTAVLFTSDPSMGELHLEVLVRLINEKG